jgi:hypothetical protein
LAGPEWRLTAMVQRKLEKIFGNGHGKDRFRSVNGVGEDEKA